MSPFVEFHLIQSFAPSNLNRDDTGAPKDALFGGHRRARISSQCLKRSARTWFSSSQLLPEGSLGTRTRHLDRLLADDLREIGIQSTDAFNEIVKVALKGKSKSEEKEDAGKEKKEEEKVLSYLLYLSVPEVEAFRNLVHEHAQVLVELASKKRIKQGDIPPALKESIRECLQRSKAVDIALFGRMLADLPAQNQNAACQVAHAISTHKVSREFDYFTAVDEKGDVGETGAGMIGQLEFSSATFYRYAVIDVVKLVENLDGDRQLALASIAAFTQAIARAIPTGKQNGCAAHNPPSFVGVALRYTSPFNLANAFERPVWPKNDRELSALSVERLATYDAQVADFYGDGRDVWAYLDMTGSWGDKGHSQQNLNQLAQWVQSRINDELGG